MATSTRPATPAPPAGRLNRGRLWDAARSTLKGQFIALATLLLLLALALALSMSTLLQRARQDLTTIGKDSAPSVDAALAMGQYIEEVDAKAADYLGTAALTEQRPCVVVGAAQSVGQLTTHDCADRAIDAGSALFRNEHYKAVRNVIYPGERTALDRISAGMDEYDANIAVMRHEYAQAASKIDPNDPHLRQAEQAYQRATAVLHTTITRAPVADPDRSPVVTETPPDCVLDQRTLAAGDWPQGSLRQNIDCFGSINKGYFDRAYANAISSLGVSLALAGVASLLFCALLLWTTWRMARVTHRAINLGLTLALLASLVLCGLVSARFATLGGAGGTFKQLVRDSYDSVYYTALLKRYGTAANAAESRWLVAVQFGDQAEADRWQQDWQASTAVVQQYLDRAIANETFPEERAPLSHLREDWARYTALDAQLRSRAADAGSASRIADAQRVSTGASNDAFGVFIGTVDQLSMANRGYFDRIYADTQATLSRDIWLAAVLFPLIGLAAVWGIYMRLRDF